MSLIKVIYNEIFYRPLLGALVFLTGLLPGNDLGLAVILLTIFIRALTFPLTHRMIKTQNAMKRIEPEVKKIYAEKKNKEEQAKALMDLYKAHGINPFSGMLSLIVQIPLLIALYRVFWKGIPFNQQEVYGFLTIPQNINTVFLGIVSLTTGSIAMSAIAAISQFWQAKLALPPQTTPNTKGDMGRMMQLQMVYVFPILIFFISIKLPAAVSLYWTSMNVFAIVHEAIVRKRSASHESGIASYGRDKNTTS